MNFFCRFGIHKWRYLPWPDDLSKGIISFVMGAHSQARGCTRPGCEKIQIPEHDSAFEYFGDWHWRTLKRDE